MRLRRGVLVLLAVVLVASACRSTYDFTGNGLADPVWHGGDGNWYLGADPEPFASFTVDGEHGVDWFPVTGDFDGDGTWEPGVVSADGVWQTAGGRGTFTFAPPAGCDSPSYWPPVGARPVPGDFHGDRATEAAWYCPLTATWYIEGRLPIAFGTAYPTDHPDAPDDDLLEGLWHDWPVPADYTGNGKADIAVYRPTDGSFWVRGEVEPIATGLGLGLPAPADYNGDGKAEGAVYAITYHEWRVPGRAPWTLDLFMAWAAPGSANYRGDRAAEVAWIEGLDDRSLWFRIEGADPIQLDPSLPSSIVGPLPAATSTTSALDFLVMVWLELDCADALDDHPSAYDGVCLPQAP